MCNVLKIENGPNIFLALPHTLSAMAEISMYVYRTFRFLEFLTIVHFSFCFPSNFFLSRSFPSCRCGPFMPKFCTSIYLFLMPPKRFRNVYAQAIVQIVCYFFGLFLFYTFSFDHFGLLFIFVECQAAFSEAFSIFENGVNGFSNPSHRFGSVRSLVRFG